MRWLLWGIAALLLLGGMIAAVGAMLPRTHVAVLRTRYRQPPERVWEAITRVADAPVWRSDLQGVEVLSSADESLRWRETSRFGPMVYRAEVVDPPNRFVSRIEAERAFGGTWTYELTPAPDGTILTITERGEVYNPIFRFMGRFVFGYYGTLTRYLEDLGRHFGEAVVVERIPQ